MPFSGFFWCPFFWPSHGNLENTLFSNSWSKLWMFKKWLQKAEFFTFSIIVPNDEHFGASWVAQTVKSLPAMRETWVRSLGWEDPLEEGMTTHASILAQRIPWTEEPGRVQFTGSQRIRHDWAMNPSLQVKIDNQQGPVVEHRELCSMSCGVWGRMDTCVCMAESLCCPPEMITTLLMIYTPI